MGAAGTINKAVAYTRPHPNLGCVTPIPLHNIRTQKGRGVVAIATAASPRFNVPSFGICQSALDIPRVLDRLLPHGYTEGQFEVFVRPMPLTPQHGFVDSRIARSTKDIVGIWEETLAHDSKGEIMIMSPISAKYNAVIHPGAVVVGRGHDGATAGHGCVTIPLIGVCGAPWRTLASLATVGQQDWPFFELVLASDNTIWWTQLRGGPQMPFGDDFVPVHMVGKAVLHVREAEGDLVEWKKICHSMLPGTAVWHPKGSLGSHYGVHCIENGIPIFTKQQPIVGMTLPKTTEIPPHNLDALRTGIVAGTMVDLTSGPQRVEAVTFVLMALHSAPRMRQESSYWLGAACTLMHRLGVAASLGEWRHAASAGKGGGKASPFAGKSRDLVYNQAFPNPFPHRKLLPAALHSFQHGSWGGGFGGKKWAACAGSIVDLDEAIMGMTLTPTTAGAATLVNALNEAVNKAHNNGWWMNKFIAASAFDQAAAHSHQTVVQALPVIFKLLELGNRYQDLALLGRRWALARKLAKDKESISALLDGMEGKHDDDHSMGVTKVPHTQLLMIHGRLDYSGTALAKIHFQYKTDGHQAMGNYGTMDWPASSLNAAQIAAIKELPVDTSYAGSDTKYHVFYFDLLDIKQGVLTIKVKLDADAELTTLTVHP